MAGFLDSIRKIVGVLESLKIDYMLLGAWALPAYGRLRATDDVDMALCLEVEVRPELPGTLATKLEKSKVKITTPFSPNTPVVVWADIENGVEGEFWLQPDGVPMEKRILDRRLKRKSDDFDIWIIGPEDFIVNKLARHDRGSVDEADVLSVLKRSGAALDVGYLRKRAKESGVSGLLDSLLKKC